MQVLFIIIYTVNYNNISNSELVLRERAYYYSTICTVCRPICIECNNDKHLCMYIYTFLTHYVKRSHTHTKGRKMCPKKLNP